MQLKKECAISDASRWNIDGNGRTVEEHDYAGASACKLLPVTTAAALTESFVPQERIADVDRREQTIPVLVDTFNRKHDYLRISLTERCNLRCTEDAYCFNIAKLC